MIEAHTIIEAPPELADVALPTERGVPGIPAADRQQHAPDLCLLAIDSQTLVARCSCWRRDHVGLIGHYAAADSRAGVALLEHACRCLSRLGCTSAVGPVDGNTSRQYRFVVERGTEPAFFLEPDHPDDWPNHWVLAGFSPCARYFSALNADLSLHDPATSDVLSRLAQAGISIRRFDGSRPEEELRRIFGLVSIAFRRNPLYAPIPETEFLERHRALLPFVRPELILIAERADELAGFMFAVPDLLQSRRAAPVDTVILKTLAVHPALQGMGLGGMLMDLVQRTAGEMGFRRAIHALMHESNPSMRISRRHAQVFRRYELFSRSLGRSVP